MRARKNPGRPKGDTPPRVPHTVYLQQSSIDWINVNVPRGTSLSAFVDKAVEEKIRKLSR